MATFCSLSSGSNGNCTYVSSGGTALLVDVGVSCKRVLAYIKEIGEDPRSIRGILITHEHSDHISGLRVLAGRLGVPVYAYGATAALLQERGGLASGQVRPVECIDRIGEIGVASFQTSHDSVDSCGYVLTMPDGKRAGIATDLGYVSKQVESALTGCELVMLESNYDEAMLECGPYPYYLKRRIRERRGHLSNEECSETLVRLAHAGAKTFCLAHLSEENNVPLLAWEFAVGTLKMNGFELDRDFSLEVAGRGKPSRVLAV